MTITSPIGRQAAPSWIDRLLAVCMTNAQSMLACTQAQHLRRVVLGIP